MHENSVLAMVGYVMPFFSNGAKPLTPWNIYLNFNHKNLVLRLEPEHFTQNGENVTNSLINKIKEFDPGWMVKGGEPIFEEAATKRQLKITDYPSGPADIQAMLDNFNKPRETTFFSVMEEVFGESSN
jgi:hypothetical protein